MIYAFRLRSHLLAVEIQDPDWAIATSTVAHILKVDEEDISILPDGHEPTCELTEVPRDSDMVIVIRGWEFQSAAYHRVMRNARNYAKKHELPEEMRMTKRAKYSNKHVATDLTIEVQNAASSVHAHMEDATNSIHAHQADTQDDIYDLRDDMHARCDGLSDVMHGLTNEMRGLKERLMGAPGHMQLKNDDGQHALEDMSEMAVDTPATVAEIVAVAPEMEAPAAAASSTQIWGSAESRKEFNHGGTIYIPAEASEGTPAESSEGKDGEESDSSSASDASEDVAPAAQPEDDAPAAQPIDAAQAMAMLDPVQPNDVAPMPHDLVVRPTNAEDAMAHGYSPVRTRVQWPPSMQEFQEANDSDKAQMYQDLTTAFRKMAQTSFELLAERDIALAQIEAMGRAFSERPQ